MVRAEALASVQIEGSSLTLEQAFELSKQLPRRELRNSEREFCNYLRAFDATDALRGERDAILNRGDLLNLHRLLLDGVRGGTRFAGKFRREEVKVGDFQNGEVVVHHQPPPWSQLVYFLGSFAYQMVQIRERARAGESEG